MFCPQWEASCTNVVGSTGEPYARCGDGYDGAGTFFLYFFTLSFLFYFHSMRTIPYLLHDFRLHSTIPTFVVPILSMLAPSVICTGFLSLSSFSLPSTLSCSLSYDSFYAAHLSKFSSSTSTSASSLTLALTLRRLPHLRRPFDFLITSVIPPALPIPPPAAVPFVIDHHTGTYIPGLALLPTTYRSSSSSFLPFSFLRLSFMAHPFEYSIPPLRSLSLSFSPLLLCLHSPPHTPSLSMSSSVSD